MSLTYPQIEKLCREIKPIIEGCICKEIVATASKTVVLSLKQGSNFYYLLLCFQEGFLRFHLCQRPDHPFFKTPFVQQLNGTLKEAELIDCSLLNEDRILALSFRKGQHSYRLTGELIPRRANCYLLDAQQHILTSINPADHLIYDLPAQQQQRHHPHAVKELLDSAAIANYYAEQEAEQGFQERKQKIEKHIKNLLKRAKKRADHCLQILKESHRWQQVHHEGVLLQSNLFRIRKGVSHVVVADWEQEGKKRTISLDPLVEPHEQAAQYFRRSKKLQKGITHAERQLKLAEQELVLRLEQQQALENISSIKQLESYCQKYPIKTPEKKVSNKERPLKKPYREYLTKAGLEIRVGKSAKDNDALTFQHANGRDWWLHARDYAGSHVVVRSAAGKKPDNDSLKDAAELALRYSKAKNIRQGEVCLTQVKDLKRVKGVAGKVMLSKHSVLYVTLDEERWKRLNHSSSSSLKR